MTPSFHIQGSSLKLCPMTQLRTMDYTYLMLGQCSFVLFVQSSARPTSFKTLSYADRHSITDRPCQNKLACTMLEASTLVWPGRGRKDCGKLLRPSLSLSLHAPSLFHHAVTAPQGTTVSWPRQTHTHGTAWNRNRCSTEHGN